MKYFFFALLILTFFSCESSEKRASKKVSQKKEAQKTQKPKKLPLLTEQNAAQTLRDYAKQYPDLDSVKITTRLGDIVVRLYEDTPLHRANFLRHIERKYYDNTEFYRIVPGFIIQGGGTSSFRHKVKKGNYLVPPEIKHLHKRGALSMANPEDLPAHKGSASSDFFIVLGEQFNRAGLQVAEKQLGRKFSSLQYETYTKTGGAPSLDGEYTVFGEVIQGMDVVEKIAKEKLLEGDTWPETSVFVEMKVIDHNATSR